MKTRIIIPILLIAFIGLANQSFAQTNSNDRKAKREKLDSLKKDYFNNALSLTLEEQKKFWPVYEEYFKKVKEIKKAFRSKYKKNDIIYMDEEGAKKYLSDLNTLKEKELALYKEYQKKFQSILPSKKVVMIYRTERDWHDKMRSFLKEKFNKKDK